GDNGIVAFAPPYGGYENASLPASGLGAFIAPLWDDFAPQDGGTIWVYTAPPTCEADCNGVVGGFGVPGECGVCLTGLEEGPPYDCAGVCGGAAAIDGCGVCAGGDTGVEAKQRDCAGVCGGTAAYDACHVCVGGTTGLEASDPESCPQGIDLIVDEEHVADTVSLDHVTVSEGDCLIHEGCVGGAGDRKVIRFATTIANIGSEDLVLGHPGDGGPHWHFDECHSHYHFEAYAAYRIIDVAAEQMLDIGSKNGFCVLDTAVYDPFIAPDGCKGYSCDDQGITAGCSDTYNADLQCQWIDVTGLPDGLYELVIETNPEQEIPEVNYVNNAAHVRVQLEGETVTVIR
ncbi:MAG: hypothetical protein KC635_14740, partial [Myxococcales bacterium]|nr:hypothetical protein [Myxococcales bacterium]